MTSYYLKKWWCLVYGCIYAPFSINELRIKNMKQQTTWFVRAFHRRHVITDSCKLLSLCLSKILSFSFSVAEHLFLRRICIVPAWYKALKVDPGFKIEFKLQGPHFSVQGCRGFKLPTMQQKGGQSTWLRQSTLGLSSLINDKMSYDKV